MFEIFLTVIGAVIDVVAIPTGLVVGLLTSHQKMMEILCWSDDVKDWMRMHKPSLLNILLVVTGFTAACVGTNIIWSAWHLTGPMYATVTDRIGFSVFGGYLYFIGLMLYFFVFR